MNLSDLVTQVWLYYIYSTMLPGIHSYYHEASYCLEDPKKSFPTQKILESKISNAKKICYHFLHFKPRVQPRMITIMQKSHFVILIDASY